MPGLELPAPRTERLTGSPLELVVCQVRHERNLAVADAKRALRVHDGLEEQYPTIDESSGMALNIVGGPTGLSTATDQQRGWSFRSSDGNWTVVLMPDFFALETKAYEDWEDFSARLAAVVRLVDEVLEPSLEQRVGLRFIDRITDPKMSAPGDWGGWIDDRLLGPILHQAFGPAIKSVQRFLQLDGGDDMEVILRHGCLLKVRRRTRRRNTCWTTTALVPRRAPSRPRPSAPASRDFTGWRCQCSRPLSRRSFPRTCWVKADGPDRADGVLPPFPTRG